MMVEITKLGGMTSSKYLCACFLGHNLRFCVDLNGKPMTLATHIFYTP